MSNDSAYLQLIEKQRKWIYNLPESEYLLPLLKLRMTESEAEFLLKIPFMPQTLEQLQPLTGLDQPELKALLDDLSLRGLIMNITGSKGTKYLLQDAFFWFYRMPGYQGNKDDFNKAISPLLNKYYKESMAMDVHNHQHKGLRTIPIQTGVKDVKTVMPFEDVQTIIDSSRFVSVSTCSCRHRKNLDPDEESCKFETRTCLHLDLLGKYLVQNGNGEEISKQEAFEIARHCADEGLVHGVSNTVNGIDTICNCCSCCCAFIGTGIILPETITKGHQPSNYIAARDSDKCKKCGLCAKRCPMKALTLIQTDTHEKDIVFSAKRCIGCGVCAHKCPTGALRLARKTQEEKYPDNIIDFVQKMLADRGLA